MDWYIFEDWLLEQPPYVIILPFYQKNHVLFTTQPKDHIFDMLRDENNNKAGNVSIS